jgi:cobalt-zinc-cadmium efflux system protein
MEGTPLHLSRDEIGSIAAVERIRSVHDLHVWTLSSEGIALSAHLVLDDMSEWEKVRLAVSAMLAERYGIDHVTLQPESGPPGRRIRVQFKSSA